ncbi:MAG: hypothetical protein JNK19_03920 [Tabrizicola sp.]|nr:hypothetical protein [Tabrizicola sp.]
MNSDKPTNPDMAQQTDKILPMPVEDTVSGQPDVLITPAPVAETSPAGEKN